MFVFPFRLIGADQEEIDAAAKGLNELNSASLSRAIDPIGGGSNAKTAENDKGDSNKKAYSQEHYITIQERDRALLQPREWLNDTLIDFWMQWYVASPHVRIVNGCPRLIHFLCCTSTLGSVAKRSI
jgi:Ulp1 family protease